MQIPEFNPEPVPVMKLRFWLAILKTFDADVLSDNEIPPGLRPECIFDYQDGLRLIISKDKIENEIFVHFSASFMEVGKNGLYDKLKPSLKAGNEEQAKGIFKKIAEERFRQLSDYDGDMDFEGFSESKGIPHWYIDFKEFKNKMKMK